MDNQPSNPLERIGPLTEAVMVRRATEIAKLRVKQQNELRAVLAQFGDEIRAARTKDVEAAAAAAATKKTKRKK